MAQSPSSSPADQPFPEQLGDIRREIDSVDERLHALLIERGAIIERVLAAKTAAGSKGSAFRPAREAELMKRLAERHSGGYPLDTAENIWRVLVATSTYIQTPYAVHGDLSGDAAAMRESARFHFGFTAPFVTAENAEEVVARVDASAGDLGMVRIDQVAAEAGAWWSGLAGAERPKIIARLPFILRADHPVGAPVYVIAKPQSDGLARDVVVAAVTIERWSRDVRAALERSGAALERSAGVAAGLSLLVSHPGAVAGAAVREAVSTAARGARYEELGSHAAQFTPA